MLSVFVVITSLYLLYVGLTAAWNILLHPLRRIPGPKLWIAFPLLRFVAAVRGRLDINLRTFHEKYGEAVRFCPDEVSFITAQAWKDIYGHGRRQLPKVLSSASNASDIISANDVDHTRFRKSLSHAFSAKGLQAQEPILTGYVDKLVERLKGVAESQTPTDMVKWYNLTTFDLIGDLAFGEPFGGLDSSEYHHWVSTIFLAIKIIPVFRLKDRYPLVAKVLFSVLPRRLLQARQQQREHTRLTVWKRLNGQLAHNRDDFMDSMLRQRGEKGGLTDRELESNANILIIAGSETTATLLSGVTYWLLRTPDAMEKVVREVRSTMATEDDITFNNVTARLPYLMACLDEAFRMYPPVPTGLQRLTPPESPITISGYQIPPKVSPQTRSPNPPQA